MNAPAGRNRLPRGCRIQTFIFFAFGTFPPSRMRSAPTFFPFDGQPYLGAQEAIRHRRAGISTAQVRMHLVFMAVCFD